MVVLHSLSAIIAASTIFSAATFASPLQSAIAPLRSRQSGYHLVRGIQEGGVQPRLNIRDLERKPENKDTWTLYILALQRLQTMDQQQKLSYYQIAGIHGAPFYEWDGVGPSWEEVPTRGYCPHVFGLFATWHRPYILLWEQLLHQHMLEIVNGIADATTKARFRTAATKFRAPYWDWAETPPSGEHVLPSSVYSETIRITYPNGTAATITNPLRAYVFHPLIPADFAPASQSAPFDKWAKTLYDPELSDSPTPTENVNAVFAKLDTNLSYAKEKLWELFTRWQPFNRFVTSGGLGVHTNLEDIHNKIHSAFGRGHMFPPSFSAFDPVFWLHHANVDRQIALWQAVYPDTWMETGSAKRTFMMDGGEFNQNTPLYPFHRTANGDFWTSSQVRQISSLNYTYPELVGNPSNATLLARLRALYEVPAPAAFISTTEQGDNDTTVRKFNAKVDIPTGFTAHLFLGEPSGKPDEWPLDTTYAGSYSTLANIGVMEDDDIFEAHMGLSQSLQKAIEDGRLEGVEEKDVVEYLKTNLHVKYTSPERKEVPLSAVGDVKAEIYSDLETVPNSKDELPKQLGTEEYGKIDNI